MAGRPYYKKEKVRQGLTHFSLLILNEIFLSDSIFKLRRNMKKSVFSSVVKALAGTNLLITLALVSCTEEVLSGPSGDGELLKFALTETTWNKLTKGQAGPESEGGCSAVGVVELRDENNGDSLFLHVSVSDGIDGMHIASGCGATKAAPVNTAGFYDAFWVSASVYSGDWDETKCIPNYFYDLEVKKGSDWTTSYFWPGAGQRISFFAYAPKDGSVVLSGKDAAGAPSISYTVPGDVKDQKDLLVACQEMNGPSAEGVAPLEFSHALTAVRFVVGDKMLACTIKEIYFKNIYYSATYRIGDTQWTGFKEQTGKACLANLAFHVSGNPGEVITSGEDTFMMIPQTLPDDAEIYINLYDDLTGKARTLKASLKGHKWPMGQTVTYKISSTSITVEPTFEIISPDDFKYSGGTGEYVVKSFVTVKDNGTSIPKGLGWKTEFVEDDGVGGYNVIGKPDWISDFNVGGSTGSTSPQKYSVSVKPQELARVLDLHNDALKAAAPVSGVYDLSTKGGTTKMNTANCYVVNAPGTYKLPCVYGNAIKDGVTNESAYKSTNTGSVCLQNFVKHDDKAITSPWIERDNAYGTGQECEILWQDVDGMLSDLDLIGGSQDGFYLQFNINKDKIRQGNAVIAMTDHKKNNPTILWSWHIWVTDYKLGEDDKVITNNNNVQYTVMPVNIG